MSASPANLPFPPSLPSTQLLHPQPPHFNTTATFGPLFLAAPLSLIFQLCLRCFVCSNGCFSWLQPQADYPFLKGRRSLVCSTLQRHCLHQSTPLTLDILSVMSIHRSNYDYHLLNVFVSRLDPISSNSLVQLSQSASPYSTPTTS